MRLRFAAQQYPHHENESVATSTLLQSERFYNIPRLSVLAANEWSLISVDFILSLMGCFMFDTATTEPPGYKHVGPEELSHYRHLSLIYSWLWCINGILSDVSRSDDNMKSEHKKAYLSH
jgi:hypothetical protein